MNTPLGLSLFLVLLNPALLFSQDASGGSGNDFGVTFGVNEYQVRETVLTNVRHRGLLATLGLSYGRRTPGSLRQLSFNAIINNLQSRYETEKLSYAFNPSIDYRHLRKVKDLGQNAALLLGAVLGWNLRMNFYEEWDESHIYWLNSYFLGISERMSYCPSERRRVNLDVDIPVISLVSRPPERFLYKELDPSFSWFVSRFHDDLTLASLNQHVEFGMTLDYEHGDPEGFRKGFFWHFSYVENDMSYSKRLSILTHTIGVILLF